ncbi:MAG: hypothetical protein ACO305_08180 [Rubrivivax sp.]
MPDTRPLPARLALQILHALTAPHALGAVTALPAGIDPRGRAPSHPARPKAHRARASWARPGGPTGRWLTQLGLPLAVALATAGPASAQDRPWTATVTQSLEHDTNLYRLPSGTSPGAGLGRSDTVSTTTLAGGVDTTFSRQRLSADAALDIVRHADNSALDHEGHALSAAWDWATAHRLSGRVQAGHARSLRPYDAAVAAGATARNLETVADASATARLGVVTRLTAEATLATRSVDYSSAASAASELRADTAALGARWQQTGATTLGAAWRHTRGRYPADGERYRSHALDLSAEITPSGASEVYLRLSPERTRYDVARERNFSGLTGAARWRWQAGGRLTLTLSGVRELGQDAYTERYGGADRPPAGAAVDDSRVLDRLTLQAEHRLSARVALRASAETTRRDLVTRTVAGGTVTLSEGRDRTDRLAVGLRWSAARALELGCDLAREQRRAGAALGSDWGATTLGCAARVGWF